MFKWEFIGNMRTIQSLLVICVMFKSLLAEWERGKIPQCCYRIFEKKSKRENDAIEERGERKINLAFLVPQLLPNFFPSCDQKKTARDQKWRRLPPIFFLMIGNRLPLTENGWERKSKSDNGVAKIGDRRGKKNIVIVVMVLPK